MIADAKLVAGGVAPVPLRRDKVEEMIIGQAPSAELAAKAADEAVADADPLQYNHYKVNELKTMVKRLIEDM